MLRDDAYRPMAMSWLETGRHQMMAFMASLWMRNPTSCSCLTATEEELVAFWRRRSPKFPSVLHRVPRMFRRYLFVSRVSCLTFPTDLSDLTFQVYIVILFLARSDFGPSVAYLTPPSWWPATQGEVLVPGDDRARMDWVVAVMYMWCVLGNVAWRSPSLTMPDHSRCPPFRWLALVSNTQSLSSWGDFIRLSR